jgi:hypothetical protein
MKSTFPLEYSGRATYMETYLKSYAQYRDVTETYMETNPKSYVQ